MTGSEIGETSPTLRRARADDVPAIAAFYARLSERSLLMRFSLTSPDDAVLATAATFDPNTSIVVLAVASGGADEVVVGEARCVPTLDGEHELGLAVLDDHQARGLGPRLLQTVREESRDRGLERLRAVVRTDNAPMLQLLSRTGCAIVDAGGGEVTVDVSTTSGMPGWPPDHARQRVVVEARSWWPTAGAAALRRHGYDVRQCLGPSAASGRHCPLVGGGECRLVREADVVACLLPAGDEDCVAVAELHRRQRPLRLAKEAGAEAVHEVRELLAAANPVTRAGPALRP